MISAVMHFVAEFGGLYPNWGGEYAIVDAYPTLTRVGYSTQLERTLS